MNKIFSVVALSLVLSNLAYAVDNNYFCAEPYNNYTVKLSFDTSSYKYSITNGETWDGVENVKSGSYEPCIDVEADRQNSASNVHWAQNHDATPWVPSYLTTTHLSKDTEPSELNFAIFGTLRITFVKNGNVDGDYECDNVLIGQGHYNGMSGGGNSVYGNNWWVANNTSTGSHMLVCKTIDNGDALQDIKVVGGQDNSDSYHMEFKLM